LVVSDVLHYPQPWPSRCPCRIHSPRVAGRSRSATWSGTSPHVTVLHKTRAWRFDLRSLRFLDKEPDPAEVPDEVVTEIKRQLELLRRAWDAMYPENPIESGE
jgi:hypothetical protein